MLKLDNCLPYAFLLTVTGRVAMWLKGSSASFSASRIRPAHVARTGDGVRVLSTVDDHIVAVEYKNQIGLAFHPELTDDTRIHEYFLSKINK